jgi:hypothetical protein
MAVVNNIDPACNAENSDAPDVSFSSSDCSAAEEVVRPGLINPPLINPPGVQEVRLKIRKLRMKTFGRYVNSCK